jgi:hypothetical protein
MPYEAPSIVEQMAAAAAAFADSLSIAQRAKAHFEFADDDARTKWYYTPCVRAGLPIREMDSLQQQLAHRLLSTGLSQPGYTAASAIMGLENILDQREEWRMREYPGIEGPWRFRDPGLYFVALFGEPGGSAPWGWHFGGHHVSVHYSIIGGRIVAPTPLFFGSNPAESEFVGGYRLAPLSGEQDLARHLLHQLDDGQRETAVIAAIAPDDILQGNRTRVEAGADPLPPWELMSAQPPEPVLQRQRERRQRALEAQGINDGLLAAIRYGAEPKGLPAGAMTTSQQETLLRLLHQYTDRMPAELAVQEASRFEAGALDAVHFAWAGGMEHREPHYYRIQGSGFLVEYDNTQNGANHIHAVWRDPEGDFGFDVLAQHYAEAH